jgi:hypothetical protein
MKYWTWTLVLLLLALTRPAVAGTRLVVLIIADDAALSNNLTEVAISRLAEKPGYELLGLHELEDRLNELPTVKTQGLRACLALAACLSELSAMAHAERAVIGDVHREGDHYRLDFALVDAKTGTAPARLSRESPLELGPLISAVQIGVSELVPDAAIEPRQPPPVAGVENPSQVRNGAPRAVEQTSTRDEKREKSSVLPYVAYGSAALAVIAFSAAAVTGTLATAPPTGESRAEVQEDVDRKQDYATVANGLLIAGGVFTGVAVVTFVVSWD